MYKCTRVRDRVQMYVLGVMYKCTRVRGHVQMYVLGVMYKCTRVRGHVQFVHVLGVIDFASVSTTFLIKF